MTILIPWFPLQMHLKWHAHYVLTIQNINERVGFFFHFRNYFLAMIVWILSIEKKILVCIMLFSLFRRRLVYHILFYFFRRRQPRPVMPRGYVGPALDDDPVEQQPQTSKPKPGAMPNPDSGVYRHAQYNSPLRMYSSDNAKEQFNIQSGGNVDVTGVNQR